jgi:cytidine deaminase
MEEFCDPDSFEIVLAINSENYKIFTLSELFPQVFGPAALI